MPCPMIFFDLFVSHPSNVNPRTGCLSGKYRRIRKMFSSTIFYKQSTDWKTRPIFVAKAMDPKICECSRGSSFYFPVSSPLPAGLDLELHQECEFRARARSRSQGTEVAEGRLGRLGHSMFFLSKMTHWCFFVGNGCCWDDSENSYILWIIPPFPL